LSLPTPEVHARTEDLHKVAPTVLSNVFVLFLGFADYLLVDKINYMYIASCDFVSFSEKKYSELVKFNH